MEIFAGYHSSPTSEVSSAAEMAILDVAVAGGPFPFSFSNSLFSNEDRCEYNCQTRACEADESNSNNIDNKIILYNIDIKMFDYTDTNSGYYLFDKEDDLFFVYEVMPEEEQFV